MSPVAHGGERGGSGSRRGRGNRDRKGKGKGKIADANINRDRKGKGKIADANVDGDRKATAKIAESQDAKIVPDPRKMETSSEDEVTDPCYPICILSLSSGAQGADDKKRTCQFANTHDSGTEEINKRQKISESGAMAADYKEEEMFDASKSNEDDKKKNKGKEKAIAEEDESEETSDEVIIEEDGKKKKNKAAEMIDYNTEGDDTDMSDISGM